MSLPESPAGAKVFQLISCIPSAEDPEVLAFISSSLSGESAAAAKKLAEVYTTARKELTKPRTGDNGTADDIIRHSVRKKLFAGKAEKSFDTSYRRLLSDLMDVLEKHLIWQEMNNGSNLRDLVLARSLSHLQTPESLTVFLYNQIFSRFDEIPADVESLWYRHRLQEKNVSQLSRVKARQYLPEVEEITRGFGQYTLLKGLKLYCILRSAILGLGKGAVPPLIAILKQYATEHREELDKLGRLYLMGAELQDSEKLSPEDLRGFLKALHETDGKVNAVELHACFKLAINCASLAKFKDPQLAYLTEEAYFSMFSHPGVSLIAIQAPYHLANFFRMSLQNKELKKGAAGRNIEEMTAHLSAGLRDSYRSYLLALSDYYQGHFQRAFDQLGEVIASTRDPFIRLTSLKFKVRILFDAQDVLLTESHLDERPGPKKNLTDSRYASVDTLLERYRKASDYGGGLSPGIMLVHQQFYRCLRELNHCLFGPGSPDKKRMKALKNVLTPLAGNEDNNWLLGILAGYLPE